MLDCVVSAAPIMIIIGASLSEPHLLCLAEVLSKHMVRLVRLAHAYGCSQ